MKKKLNLLPLFLITCGSIYSFNSLQDNFEMYHHEELDVVSFSSGPPTARTGAPGENNCTACHQGSTVSADGVIDFTFSGSNGYIPGETYDITIATADGDKNGFQLTILDDNDNKAGEFIAGTKSEIKTANDREYIGHSAADVKSWTFQWTAPSSDLGSLTAYFAFNKADNSGNTSGDIIHLGQATIDANKTMSLTKYEKLDADFIASINQKTANLSVSYKTKQSANIVVQMTDMNGKLILNEKIGVQSKGKHKEVIDLSDKKLSGVYIVSLFQNNLVFNRKVMIQ